MPLDALARALFDLLAYENWWNNEEPGAHDALAFDFQSVRSYDPDGRLHVSNSPISKANICEYYGKEIPAAGKLGLDPDAKYRLYRHPDELARAASTFNNLPIIDRHMPVGTFDEAKHKNLIIGTTGSHAAFDAPYLNNSLAFWNKPAIEDIEQGHRRQLSAGYRYRADMTPGEIAGEPFDGVMRDLHGSHLALVPEGRAGDDVIVGDELPQENRRMPAARTHQSKLSRQALMLHGAIAAYARPMLAQDAKLPDLVPALTGVTAKTWANKDRRAAAVRGIVRAFAGVKLAQDQALTDEGVGEFLEQLEGTAPVEETDDASPVGLPRPSDQARQSQLTADQGGPLEKVLDFLRGKLAPEDMAELQAMTKEANDAWAASVRPKGDADPEESEEDKLKREAKEKADREKERQGMDARLAAVRRETEAAVMQTMREIREAERVARPYVGEIAMAQDSAQAVYKLALDTIGVKVGSDVHPSAYRHILEAQPKPRQESDREPVLSMDAAAAKSFGERFPQAARLKR